MLSQNISVDGLGKQAKKTKKGQKSRREGNKLEGEA